MFTLHTNLPDEDIRDALAKPRAIILVAFMSASIGHRLGIHLDVVTNTTLFTYGVQAGWTSPMTKVLQSEESPTGHPMSDYTTALVAGVTCVAAGLSTPVYAWFADNYGRKTSMIAIALPQAFGWFIKLAFPSCSALIVARVICGIASGGCFNIIPMYTKEISQDNVRGQLGSFLALFQNLGLLAMYAIGAYFDYYTVLWIVIWIPLVNALAMLWTPESPAYLIKIGRIDEAIKTFAFLRGLDVEDEVVKNEIECLKNEDFYFQGLPSVTFRSIMKNNVSKKCFLLLMTLSILFACNGSFAIIVNAASIIESTGTKISPELQALSLPAVMILGSLVSMTCVEKLGRKPILVSCVAMAAVSTAGVGAVIHIEQRGGSVPGWLPILLIISMLFSQAAGILPIPYIMMSEMFNFQIRSKLMGVIVMLSWFVSFTQLTSYTAISNALGMHSTFYCFAVVNLLGLYVSLVYLPETRGKTVQQIEMEMK